MHAYRGSQPVTTTTGSFFWKRTQTNQVVREYGPRDYFTRNLGRLICSYPTRGELDVSTGEISMAFLSVVDHTTAVTYLFSVAGTPQGSRVRRLIRTYRADF